MLHFMYIPVVFYIKFIYGLLLKILNYFMTNSGFTNLNI